MAEQIKSPTKQVLLSNSRFWVLTSGLIVSVIVLGLVQQQIPSGSLQAIRLEEAYGFISLSLLFLALLATPLSKVFPKLIFKEQYLHSRRAIGVLCFYYASLHAGITFFKQLGGIHGIKYLNERYTLSLLAAVGALFILLLMAATSTDWAVNTLTFKNWKRLHRFVYLAGVLIVFHIWLIGTHYIRRTLYYELTIIALALLLALQLARISIKRKQKDSQIS